MSIASMTSDTDDIITALTDFNTKYDKNPSVCSMDVLIVQTKALANVVKDLIAYTGDLNDDITALTGRVTTLEGEV